MRHILIVITLVSFSLADFIRVWAGGNLPVETSNTSSHIWILAKHPVPVVPNIRVEQTKSKQSISRDFILYYNVLDNLFWVTFDVGAGVSLISATDSIDTKDALGFARFRFQVPASSFGAEALLKRSLAQSAVNDITLKIDWDLFETPVVDIGVEGGYRVKGEDKASEYSFAGLVAKF